MSTERDLLIKCRETHQALRAAEQLEKEARAAYEKAVDEMLQHFDETGKSATAKYDGLGYIMEPKPRVYASVKEENFDAAKTYLIDSHREDLMKLTINAGSISAHVKELLSQGNPVPGCISYYLKRSINFYG